MLKLLFVIVLMVSSGIVAFAEPRPYFIEPSLSPARKEIAFVSGGDIWTVPATGGVASLLVSHAANEARPIYSPDGRQLAFISSRTGSNSSYVFLCFLWLKQLQLDRQVFLRVLAEVVDHFYAFGGELVDVGIESVVVE